MPRTRTRERRSKIKILFLDINGVISPNGPGQSFPTFSKLCIESLNQVLLETSAVLVIGSSWRYLVHNGDMSLHGFYYMLRTHGLTALSKIIGVTRRDNVNVSTLDDRCNQIRDWISDFDGKIDTFAIVDDHLIRGFHGKFVQTNPSVGLSTCNADQLIAILKDGDDRHYWGTEEEWEEIQRNALSADEIDEVREHLRETGQDIGDG